jgi:cobalamin biosynthesis protein CobW
MTRFRPAHPLHRRHRLPRRRQDDAYPQPARECRRQAKLAVIVNEFGDVGIDGEILRGCGIETCPRRTSSNWRMAASAAPWPTISCRRWTISSRAAPKVDHILIETSGLALPKPLVQAFQWPAVRNRVTVDSVVAVVDGPALRSRRGNASDRDALAAAAGGRRIARP